MYPCPSCCECCCCNDPDWRVQREAVVRHAADSQSEQVAEVQRLAKEAKEVGLKEIAWPPNH